MNKVLFDTSVFIPLLRQGRFLEDILQLVRGEVFYLSGVVAQELYSGARDKKFLWNLDKLYCRLEKAGRVIVPGAADWRVAGHALSRFGNRYGFQKIKISTLVNDALIASSCKREGITLLTLNVKDFKRLREVIEFEFRVYGV